MRTCLAIAAVVSTALQPPAPPAAPPDTEIFVAGLALGAQPRVSAAANVTNTRGYDNQPSFSPDGRSMYFTSNRGGTQTDIYRYDFDARTTSRVTETPESEYSPAVTPDGAHLSVVRVEADGTQRLWQFTLEGKQPEVVLEGIKPVGYYAWGDDRTLALFVLGPPATLQLADRISGKADTLARGILRSVQRVPRAGTFSFVDRDEDGSLMIRELDPKTRGVTTITAAVAGAKEADLAWAADGTLLMAEKDVLYRYRRDDRGWTRLADLAALGIRGASRLAVSPRGDRIAVVAQP
jgi:dipeptidyl aminopeptidase/acylaminoacyl peptidase